MGYAEQEDVGPAQIRENQKLEAECAAMREALERIRDGKDKCHGMITADMGFAHFAQHTSKLALGSTAGADLLAELRALREISKYSRIFLQDSWDGADEVKLAKAIANLDDLRSRR